MPPLSSSRKALRLLLPILIATAAGSLAALSFHPAGAALAAPAALLPLFYLVWRAVCWRVAFFLGLAFGFALFAAGLWWIFAALSGHVGLPVAGALPLTVLFCLALALYPALALALATLISPPNGMTRLLTIAACWTLAEVLRGHLFTGFPWLSLGYSQIPSGWLAGWAPITGVFGITLALTLTLACGIALALAPRRRLASLAIIAVVFAAAPLINNIWQWVTPAGTLQVSLLQGNVKQSLKWQPDVVKNALDNYTRLAESSEGRLVVLPETALPMLIDDLPENYLDNLRALAEARIGAVIAGVFDSDDGGIYNAAIVLQQGVTSTYRKVHLTPYGEYLPFADFLKPLLGAVGIPYSSLTAGARAAPARLPDGILTAMSICYEDIFGDEWRRQLPAAHFLTNITNDAWFDETIMPQQHLRMAQARALETGRWLVRATNTGVTAFVNERGEVVARLPMKVDGVLTHEINLFRGATPYVRLGDAAPALLALFIIIAGALLQAHRRRQTRRAAAAVDEADTPQKD